MRDLLRAHGQPLVGRDAELRWARENLGDTDRPNVLHLHGPGGVGKTALLREIERVAGDLDRPTVWLDGKDLQVDRVALLVALRVPDPAATAAPPSQRDLSGAFAPDSVVLIDHFEVFGSVESWVYQHLVPALPADVRLVLACRRRPPESAETLRLAVLLTDMPVRNLTAEQSEELLRRCGIPPEVDVDALVRATHGHPLALVIAADRWVGTAGSAAADAPTGDLLRHPDPAARLLRRFIDDIEEPLQREALHVAAHTRRVDRAMLRHALRVDDATADDLLQWLRDRPYAEAHPDGLGLHDVARDAIETDLRWRDPEAYNDLHDRVRSVIVGRLRGGDPAVSHRAGTDLVFLNRSNPLALALFDYDRLGTMTMRQAVREDHDRAVAITDAGEGPVRAAALADWTRSQPRSLHVMESGREVVGLASFVALSEATDEQRAGDPVAVAAWDAVCERRPPAKGELVLSCLAVDDLNPERLGGVSDLMAVRCLQMWAHPDLGWSIMATSRLDLYGPVWQYIGFEPLTRLTTSDGRDVHIWARDFRRSPFDEWLEALGAREIDADGRLPHPVAAPVALSREDFATYARVALHAYHRDEVLAGSPLLASVLVQRGLDGADRARAVQRLRDVLAEAVADLEDDPALAKAARALDRTYLRRTSTQEAAAEVLGMPFSTYRRHLAKGHQAWVTLLWQREIGGERRVSTD